MLKLNIGFPSMSDPPPPKNMNPNKEQSLLHSVRGSSNFSVKPKKDTKKTRWISERNIFESVNPQNVSM